MNSINRIISNRRLLATAFLAVYLAVMLVGAINPTTNVLAAPPQSLLVTNFEGTAECLAQLSLDNEVILPSSLLTAMSDSSDPAIVDDIFSITDRKGNGDRVFSIKFVPVNAPDGPNLYICEEANMFSRPSSPNDFMGYNSNTNSLITARLNAPLERLEFAAGSRSATIINVINNPSSGDVLANPVFGGSSPGGGGTTGGGGATGVGYCSYITFDSARNACMQVAVRDFNTMTYRGETYVLEDWDADNDDFRYRLTDTPYEARKFFLTQQNSCRPQLLIGLGNSDFYKGGEYDLSADNNEPVHYQQVLDTLDALPETGRIGYLDFDSSCTRIYWEEINANSFRNLRTMFQVFPKENKIVFITNKPASNNSNFIMTFTKDANNPLRYNAPPQNATCTSAEVIPHIILDSEPVETEGAPAISGKWYYQTNADNCSNGTVVDASILVKQTSSTSTETTTSLGASSGTSATDSGAQEVAVPEKTCSSEGGGLGWIVCPVLTVMDEATQWLENQIRGFLFVEPEQFNKDGDGAGLYRSWSTFRGLATIVIVIIALLMIFSQAMGEGVFNNYSVKKLLPRLIIAGIGIQLSWFLITELINVFNILGNGISGLIMSPFTYVNETSGAPVVTSLTVDTNLRDILPTSTAGGQGVMAGIVIAGGIALVGAAGALAIGATAAVFVGFITLIVRNIIIFLGVIFAPVAIAMSVLPGTQKTAKWWWESLSKALMMYPIVMVLFAGGKIVSNILMTSGPANAGLDAVTTIAAIAAWYAPYFFLPKALQAGGSALSKVTGLAGDKSKGMFDKARQASDARKKYKGAAADRRAFAGEKGWMEKGKYNPLRATGIGGAIGYSSRNLRKGGVYAKSGGFGASTDDKNLRSKISTGVKSAYEKEQSDVAEQAWSSAGSKLVNDSDLMTDLARYDLLDAAGKKSVEDRLSDPVNGHGIDITKMSDVGKFTMRSKAVTTLVKQKKSENIAKLFGDTVDIGADGSVSVTSNSAQAKAFHDSDMGNYMRANLYGDVKEITPQYINEDAVKGVPGASLKESAKANAKTMSTWKDEQFGILARDYDAAYASAVAGGPGAEEVAAIESQLKELSTNDLYKGGISAKTRAMFGAASTTIPGGRGVI